MYIEYNYLRPKKAEYAKNTHKESLECRTELCVESYRNAVILPLKKCGTAAMFGCGGVVDNTRGLKLLVKS